MKISLQEIKSYVIMSFGCLLTAIAWTAFLIPAKITGGGLSGISALIFFTTGIPVGLTYMVLNIALVLIAMKLVGVTFGIKTIFGVIALSIFLSIMQLLVKQPIVKDQFMATIVGGILNGSGIGIVFAQGGSTGGTDIIAMLINKNKNISLGRIVLFIDMIIISSSFLVFHSIEKIVYGYVFMAITSYSIDLMIEGSKQSLQIFIISKMNNLVADTIGKELKRGVTFIQGRGWFTNEDKEIIMVIVRKHQLNTVLDIVNKIDDDAFISVGSVMGVYGKGFNKIN